MKSILEKKSSGDGPAVPTEKNLSRANCDTNFYGSLRSSDPSKSHPETKLVFVPENPSSYKRKEQTSQIFSNEPQPEISRPQKTCHYIPSKVMFNDNYVENNPKISENRKLRYKIEERKKKEGKCTDEFRPKNTKNIASNKKINDYYLSNPFKVFDKDETKKYNAEEKEKKTKHLKAFNAVFGSEGVKRTLGGNHNYSRTNYNTISCKTEGNYRSNINNNGRMESNKVTNNDFNINKNAVILNRKGKDEPVPYFGRRHFGAAPCGAGNAMTYL